MTSRDFCYWLQGHFELNPQATQLNAIQIEAIRKHLALVFAHEIDPQAGPPEKQGELNAIHGGVVPPLGPVMRC